MKLSVKTGDNVVVIAGKDKGKTGKVIAAYPAAGRVKVEDVNVVTKHKKPRSAQVPGGKFKEPAAIDVSNVQVICPSCNKATRVRHAEADGKKVRACGKCGASLDVVKLDKKAKKAAEKPAKSTKSKKKDEVKEVKEVEAEVVETTEATAAKPAAKKPAAKKAPAKKDAAADAAEAPAKKTAAKKPAAKKAAAADDKTEA